MKEQKPENRIQLLSNDEWNHIFEFLVDRLDDWKTPQIHGVNSYADMLGTEAAFKNFQKLLKNRYISKQLKEAVDHFLFSTSNLRLNQFITTLTLLSSKAQRKSLTNSIAFFQNPEFYIAEDTGNNDDCTLFPLNRASPQEHLREHQRRREIRRSAYSPKEIIILSTIMIGFFAVVDSIKNHDVPFRKNWSRPVLYVLILLFSLVLAKINAYRISNDVYPSSETNKRIAELVSSLKGKNVKNALLYINNNVTNKDFDPAQFKIFLTDLLLTSPGHKLRLIAEEITVKADNAYIQKEESSKTMPMRYWILNADNEQIPLKKGNFYMLEKIIGTKIEYAVLNAYGEETNLQPGIFYVQKLKDKNDEIKYWVLDANHTLHTAQITKKNLEKPEKFSPDNLSLLFPEFLKIALDREHISPKLAEEVREKTMNEILSGLDTVFSELHLSQLKKLITNETVIEMPSNDMLFPEDDGENDPLIYKKFS